MIQFAVRSDQEVKQINEAIFDMHRTAFGLVLNVYVILDYAENSLIRYL